MCKVNKIIWSFRIFRLFSIILRLKSAINSAFNFSKQFLLLSKSDEIFKMIKLFNSSYI